MKLKNVYEKYGTKTKLNITDIDGVVFKDVTIYSFTGSNDDDDGANVDVHVPGKGYVSFYEDEIKFIDLA